MLTVLTATYNRAYTLSRLYESLERQTNKSFEWVVVDDGSADETLELLAGFQKKSTFPIRFLQQENSGKHVAINTGVSVETRGWIFLVDSDDALTPDAVEVFLSDLTNTGSKDLVGYCYRRADFSGRLIGNVVSGEPESSAIMSPVQAGPLYRGDLAYIFKKDVLIKCPFPRFEGENFVPELLIWNKVSDEGGVLYFHHRAIYLCEYLADGYSANFYKNLQRNPVGFGVFYKDQMGRETNLIRKLKCAIRYVQCLFFGFKNRRNV
ncbi:MULTISPECIES: glycosyltransferase family 2 protein [Pseudomonas]|uniref:glycosyltransferase family A protein n=1 Tax=Pseudomonas TaxID=286 RepID=UPI002AB0915B|nr:glycosyltransferase family 2 protein [Pseudomonas sp. V3/3/4/13]